MAMAMTTTLLDRTSPSEGCRPLAAGCQNRQSKTNKRRTAPPVAISRLARVLGTEGVRSRLVGLAKMSGITKRNREKAGEESEWSTEQRTQTQRWMTFGLRSWLRLDLRRCSISRTSRSCDLEIHGL